MDVSELMLKAIKIRGSQAELAKACGCSQQTISAVKTGQRGVKAELAHMIDLATSGQVPKHQLCPAIFDTPN